MAQFNLKDFDIKRNMYIQASAGTGKTYTVQQIVAEVLKLDLKEQIGLEDILIVTYTEKAAGELRDRIREKIQDVINREEYAPDTQNGKYLTVEKQKEKFYKQLELVDNAPIYTIHSFCKQTLTEFGFTANQSDNLELIDENQVNSFIQKWLRDDLPEDEIFKKYMILTKGKGIKEDQYTGAIGKLYRNENGEEVPEIMILDKTTSRADLQRFTSKELERLSNEKQTPDDYNFICNFLDKVENTSIKTEADDIRNPDEAFELKRKLSDLSAFTNALQNVRNQAALKSIGIFYNKLVGAIAENDVLKLPTTVASYIKTHVDQNLGIYYENVGKKIKAFKEVKTTIENNFKCNLFETHLPEIYMNWNKYKADNKLQSFDDMIRNVRESVCKPDSALKQKLKEKYKFAIIDEFQDTNPKQWDIFSRVFMEDENHSICVVGDPKQSIYAFQGADVNVYSAAIKQIADGNPNQKVAAGQAFDLAVNYRSTNKTIEVCNKLFANNGTSDFFTGTFTFTDSGTPQNPALVKPDAEFDGTATKPVWIPDAQDPEQISPLSFADFVVEQIIKCCTFDSTGKTRLQVFHKNSKDKNVNFSDFAVLCKSKSEMEEIKLAFAKSGIPYNHYKESNLFTGKECFEWISLFNAINAEDFTSSNRKILNEALFTDFFGISLARLSSSEFDRPNCKERLLIIKWQSYAKKRQWALLQEQIFETSQVESRLSKLDKLTSLSKLRQIGDYCVNYLYKNNCTIDELINHLTLLCNAKGDADDEDGNIVQKGTDFNCVQIMTIHASKGLEFPVVILPAGLKAPKANTGGIYQYHDSCIPQRLHLTANKNYILPGATATAGDIEKDERDKEWTRIFYVAYTRASSLMISPWTVAKGYFRFLKSAFISSDANNNNYLERIPLNLSVDYRAMKNKVSEILSNQVSANTGFEAAANDEAEQKKVTEKLSHNVRLLNVYKLSYTNISKGNIPEQYASETNAEHDRSRESVSEKYGMNKLDPICIRIPVSTDSANLNVMDEKYPKGNLVGEAVHQIFENTDFNKIGSYKTEDEVCGDAAFAFLIREKFAGQGIIIDSSDSKNIKTQTAKIVWNTMNAVFPEITGSKGTGNSFSLKELEKNQYMAEREFNMNPYIKQNEEQLRDYFNGFIDLIFVREAEGEKRYSIIDWKSNYMPDQNYADSNALAEETDNAYSIQRVLYSYCLIKWLKQFSSKSEQEIFEQQFGGIYYVYVRGCKAGNGNGIYAHTWNSWEELKAAFLRIVDQKLSKGNKKND